MSNWWHLPTPGDHYSPRTGSAIMTIISELSMVHAKVGGHSTIVVGRNTMGGYYEGHRLEVSFQRLPARHEKMLDMLNGAAGRKRSFVNAVYEPAVAAIPNGFRDVIFAWNQPAILPELKSRYPDATICLYAQNELFRTYTRAEAKRVLSAADKIFACSNFIAEGILDIGGTDLADKIVAVINGVNTQKFAPPMTPRTADTATILFIGRVQPEKGPHLLIQAAQRLSRRHKFRIKIVGSSGFSAKDALSDYEQQLRRLASQMDSCIEFHPFIGRDEVITELAKADIFCVPSVWNEPCSLTVSEAMASGLPTVASNRGGLPEAGGRGAIYFDPSNLDELTRIFNYLLDDRDARNAWGKRARQRALEISWERQYQLITQALASVTPISTSQLRKSWSLQKT